MADTKDEDKKDADAVAKELVRLGKDYTSDEAEKARRVAMLQAAKKVEPADIEAVAAMMNSNIIDNRRARYGDAPRSRTGFETVSREMSDPLKPREEMLADQVAYEARQKEDLSAPAQTPVFADKPPEPWAKAMMARALKPPLEQFERPSRRELQEARGQAAADRMAPAASRPLMSAPGSSPGQAAPRPRPAPDTQPAGDAVAAPKTPTPAPQIDEFAHLGTPSPPVGTPPELPTLSRPQATSVFAPIKVPVDRDLRLEDLPAGFKATDAGIVDPQDKPARLRYPSAGEIASDLAGKILPVVGGLFPGALAGLKAGAGGLHAAAGVLGAGPIARGRRAATAAEAQQTLESLDRSLGAKAAPFPQYAEAYPPTVPGVPTTDPKTGKAYIAKQLSPEAEAFAAKRAQIMKDMQKGGYEPYFDPEKRYYPDPANYPPNTPTRDIVPTKPATVAKDLATIASPEAIARLEAAYTRGAQMPNTKDWYAMGQLEDAFVRELGPEAGRKAFQNKFATAMAATTGGADPPSNLLMAQYGNYLREHNLPYPTAGHEMPFPIGGRYVTGNMEMHRKTFDAGGWPDLGEKNPKRHNFAQNFMGNRDVATMDEQMTSGMTPGVNMPPPGKYGLYEGTLADTAARFGVPPANFQDVAWAGFKNMKDPRYTSGQPMISVVNEAIERTHRLTGMPKEEIVRRGLVRSEIPLYSGAAPFVPWDNPPEER